MAPFSKLMIGSGGHGSSEISWLSAKIALGEVLTDAVRLGLMSERDAEKTGRMILYDKATRMYGQGHKAFPTDTRGKAEERSFVKAQVSSSQVKSLALIHHKKGGDAVKSRGVSCDLPLTTNQSCQGGKNEKHY